MCEKTKSYSYVSKFLMISEKCEGKAGVRITVCPGVMVGSKFLNISLKALLKWIHALTASSSNWKWITGGFLQSVELYKCLPRELNGTVNLELVFLWETFCCRMVCCY